MIDSHTFVQSHRMYSSKSEPYSKLKTLEDVSVCSSVVTNIPLQWDILVMGEPNLKRVSIYKISAPHDFAMNLRMP